MNVQKLRKRRKQLTSFVIMLVITILMFELGLRFIDPLGAYALWHDTLLRQVGISHPTGYEFLEGTFEGIEYSATHIENGLRLVPDSNESACTVAWVGDSFTYGNGANDNQTLPNWYARDNEYRVLNTGRGGYNTAEVLQLVKFYEADAYIYFHFGNDNEATRHYDANRTEFPTIAPNTPTPSDSALSVYIRYFLTRGKPLVTDNEAYEGALAELASMENVLILSFEDTPLTQVWDYGAVAIARPAYPIVSYADHHPTGDGYGMIYQEMKPHIEYFVDPICKAVLN